MKRNVNAPIFYSHYFCFFFENLDCGVICVGDLVIDEDAVLDTDELMPPREGRLPYTIPTPEGYTEPAYDTSPEVVTEEDAEELSEVERVASAGIAGRGMFLRAQDNSADEPMVGVEPIAIATVNARPQYHSENARPSVILTQTSGLYSYPWAQRQPAPAPSNAYSQVPPPPPFPQHVAPPLPEAAAACWPTSWHGWEVLPAGMPQ